LDEYVDGTEKALCIQTGRRQAKYRKGFYNKNKVSAIGK
jgi:hypothetical protein